MKKLLMCLSILAIVACKKEAPKDYVTLTGKITNQISDSLFIYQGRTFSKTIKVNEDGTFSDTLKVIKGMYGIYDGKKAAGLFLKNGYDLNFTADAKEFVESIKFSGNGSESNNYLIQKTLMQKELIKPSILDLEEELFNKKIVEIEAEMTGLLEKNSKELDSMIISNEKQQISIRNTIKLIKQFLTFQLAKTKTKSFIIIIVLQTEIPAESDKDSAKLYSKRIIIINCTIYQ